MSDISKHTKVNTPQMLKEACENGGNGMGIFRTPFNTTISILAQVAERAIELNDPKLNALMMKLCLYDVANPESEDFDQTFVHAYIEEHL